MAVKFNLNDKVLVRIKPEGLEIIKNKYKDLICIGGESWAEQFIQNRKVYDGRYVVQVHELMWLFGDNINMYNSAIEMEVEFE